MRYDVELLPITNAFNPFFERRTCRRQEQHRAEAGLHLEALRHRDLDRPRRLRHLLRQDHDDHDDAVRVDRRLQRFVHACISHQLGGPGPSRGQLPTDPMLVNGPVVNRPRSTRCSRRVDGPQHRPGLPRQSRPAVPQVQQLSLGYERQVGQHMAVTADYIRSWNRDQLINYDLNPGLRVDTSRTAGSTTPTSEHRRPARHLAVRQPGAHSYQRRLVAV
jgi:hypothetical protein